MNHLLTLLRGALIGVAEVIPGVSGGTLALVLGVYQRIVNAAADFVSASLKLFRGRFVEAGKTYASLPWLFLLTLLAGMFLAIVGGAALIEPLLESSPEIMRALFAGLILASIAVPLQLAGRWRSSYWLGLGVGAVVAFGLTSMPRSAEFQPEPWQIVLGAAVAVCALVLPGVSGSFLLLAIGLYAPTLAAVNDRNFSYLGLFVLGAVLGLGAFASLLKWLLNNYLAPTMIVMAGLMLGSLRALWPWQNEQGGLLPPTDLLAPVAVFLVGIAIVAGLIFAQARFESKD